MPDDATKLGTDTPAAENPGVVIDMPKPPEAIRSSELPATSDEAVKSLTQEAAANITRQAAEFLRAKNVDFEYLVKTYPENNTGLNAALDTYKNDLDQAQRDQVNKLQELLADELDKKVIPFTGAAEYPPSNPDLIATPKAETISEPTPGTTKSENPEPIEPEVSKPATAAQDVSAPAPKITFGPGQNIPSEKLRQQEEAYRALSDDERAAYDAQFEPPADTVPETPVSEAPESVPAAPEGPTLAELAAPEKNYFPAVVPPAEHPPKNDRELATAHTQALDKLDAAYAVLGESENETLDPAAVKAFNQARQAAIDLADQRGISASETLKALRQAGNNVSDPATRTAMANWLKLLNRFVFKNQLIPADYDAARQPLSKIKLYRYLNGIKENTPAVASTNSPEPEPPVTPPIDSTTPVSPESPPQETTLPAIPETSTAPETIPPPAPLEKFLHITSINRLLGSVRAMPSETEAQRQQQHQKLADLITDSLRGKTGTVNNDEAWHDIRRNVMGLATEADYQKFLNAEVSRLLNEVDPDPDDDDDEEDEEYAYENETTEETFPEDQNDSPDSSDEPPAPGGGGGGGNGEGGDGEPPDNENFERENETLETVADWLESVLSDNPGGHVEYLTFTGDSYENGKMVPGQNSEVLQFLAANKLYWSESLESSNATYDLLKKLQKFVSQQKTPIKIGLFADPQRHFIKFSATPLKSQENPGQNKNKPDNRPQNQENPTPRDDNNKKGKKRNQPKNPDKTPAVLAAEKREADALAATVDWAKNQISRSPSGFQENLTYDDNKKLSGKNQDGQPAALFEFLKTHNPYQDVAALTPNKVYNFLNKLKSLVTNQKENFEIITSGASMDFLNYQIKPLTTPETTPTTPDNSRHDIDEYEPVPYEIVPAGATPPTPESESLPDLYREQPRDAVIAAADALCDKIFPSRRRPTPPPEEATPDNTTTTTPATTEGNVPVPAFYDSHSPAEAFSNIFNRGKAAIKAKVEQIGESIQEAKAARANQPKPELERIKKEYKENNPGKASLNLFVGWARRIGIVDVDARQVDEKNPAAVKEKHDMFATRLKEGFVRHAWNEPWRKFHNNARHRHEDKMKALGELKKSLEAAITKYPQSGANSSVLEGYQRQLAAVDTQLRKVDRAHTKSMEKEDRHVTRIDRQCNKIIKIIEDLTKPMQDQVVTQLGNFANLLNTSNRILTAEISGLKQRGQELTQEFKTGILDVNSPEAAELKESIAANREELQALEDKLNRHTLALHYVEEFNSLQKRRLKPLTDLSGHYQRIINEVHKQSASNTKFIPTSDDPRPPINRNVL